MNERTFNTRDNLFMLVCYNVVYFTKRIKIIINKGAYYASFVNANNEATRL